MPDTLRLVLLAVDLFVIVANLTLILLACTILPQLRPMLMWYVGCLSAGLIGALVASKRLSL
jgi:hypothetical protein